MSELDVIVGIDLGTHSSAVAAVVEGMPTVVPNPRGFTTTPSVVAITSGGKLLVGHVAKHQAVLNQRNTVTGLKRLIGTRWSSPAVGALRRRAAFSMLPAAQDQLRIRLQGRAHSAVELCTLVLADLKQSAEAYLGGALRRAVIAVPVYYDELQREAVVAAAGAAGIVVVELLEEPEAAVLSCGLRLRPAERRLLLVYDFGGGSFECAVLLAADGHVERIGAAHDLHVGGELLDERLVNHVLAVFQERHGVDLRSDARAMQRVHEAAERVKHELSHRAETTLDLPLITEAGGQVLDLCQTLGRGQVEHLAADLVEQTFRTCDEALGQAGVGPADIDELLLVGGQAHMPLVRELAQRYFQRPPRAGLDPDGAVALGAAVRGLQLGPPLGVAKIPEVEPLELHLPHQGCEEEV